MPSLIFDGSVMRNATDGSGLCIKSVWAKEALGSMDLGEHGVSLLPR